MPLVRSAWPIHDVWQARTQPRETIDIVVEGRPQDVVVARAGFQATPVAVEAGLGVTPEMSQPAVEVWSWYCHGLGALPPTTLVVIASSRRSWEFATVTASVVAAVRVIPWRFACGTRASRSNWKTPALPATRMTMSTKGHRGSCAQTVTTRAPGKTTFSSITA